MARTPSLRNYWRANIQNIAANNPAMSPGAVLRALEIEIANRQPPNEAREELPSLDTVRRILVEFRDEDPNVQRQYQFVKWPQSLGTPDLPWEASSAVVELLQHYQRDLGLTPVQALSDSWQRPTIRTAKWFWRVTQAAPWLSVGRRRRLAGWMVAAELAEAEQREQLLRIAEIVLLQPENYPGLDQIFDWLPADGTKGMEVMSATMGPYVADLLSATIEEIREASLRSESGQEGTTDGTQS